MTQEERGQQTGSNGVPASADGGGRRDGSASGRGGRQPAAARARGALDHLPRVPGDHLPQGGRAQSAGLPEVLPPLPDRGSGADAPPRRRGEFPPARRWRRPGRPAAVQGLAAVCGPGARCREKKQEHRGDPQRGSRDPRAARPGVRVRVRLHGRQHGQRRRRADRPRRGTRPAAAHPADHRLLLRRRPDAGGALLADADGQDGGRPRAPGQGRRCPICRSSPTRPWAG